MSGVLFSWTVPSFTRRDMEYKVRLLEDSRMICSCPAFVNHPYEDCKHIRSVRKGNYDPDDVPTHVVLASMELEKNHVRNTGATTESTKLFHYGTGWRVRWTKVSNDQANSRLLAEHDHLYLKYVEALAVFKLFTE